MIGIVLPSNLKFAPYAAYYIKKLEKEGISYEIISWNRQGIDENCAHVFQHPVADSDRFGVLRGYMEFVRFANKVIRRQKYSGLIVFTVAAGFFLSPTLRGKYNRRFLFDIRDDSPIVKRLPKAFRKLCAAAYAIGISSPEFSSWVPGTPVMCHNADMDTIAEHFDDVIHSPAGDVKNIVFAGMLIEGKINLELVKMFQNDPDFGFGFVGTECADKKAIADYAEQNQVKNVFFQGPYNKTDITAIYRDKSSYVNIIRKESKVNAQAVPNKLYDAVIAGRPVIVLAHNKAVARYVTEYGLGIVLDELTADEIKERIAEFERTQLETGAYLENRKRFLMRVREDNVSFDNMIESFTAECGEVHG